MVEGFDGLLEGDGDEQADADGGDVDEKVAPGVGRLVRRVDVELGGLLLAFCLSVGAWSTERACLRLSSVGALVAG